VLFTFSYTTSALECADDDFYTYNGNKNQTCAWVAQDTENRCSEIDVNYIEVRDRCRVTCDNCGSTVAIGRTTGQWCTEGSQCSSGVCRQHTCYASDYCKTLKQPWGDTFERNKVILVFVGSGFTDHKEWQEQVHDTFSVFNQFPMFANSNLRFNVFYVDMLEEEFCEYGCKGIDTLLCCNTNTAKVLASKCFPPQATLHTIVIHNDEKYGGAGYRNSNMATTGTHADSGYIAVHELGHSLFEFGDEYKEGKFNAANSANCDVAGCPKWSDLSDHLGMELCVSQHCQGGNYFVAEPSFMDDFRAPVGVVNLRFTCCTYLALTKGVPSYCDRFEFGLGLVEYCKNDYQNYGELDYQNLYSSEQFDKTYDYQFRSRYFYVARPAVIYFDLNEETFGYVDQHNRFGTTPAIHRRRQMLGDYYDIYSAFHKGVKKVHKITIKYDSDQTQELLFNPIAYIDSPIEDELVVMAIGDDDQSIMEIIVDGSKGLVDDVEFEEILINSWTVFCYWVSTIWHGFVDILSIL